MVMVQLENVPLYGKLRTTNGRKQGENRLSHITKFVFRFSHISLKLFLTLILNYFGKTMRQPEPSHEFIYVGLSFLDC